MTNRLRVGLVGAGMIVDETYRPAFLQLAKRPLFSRSFGAADVALVGVASKTGSRARTLKQRHRELGDFAVVVEPDSVKKLIDLGVSVNITAIGVVAGYVFAKQADAITLLIIPILSPTLGMLWIDHDINIRSIGRFIGGEWSRAMDVYVDSSLPTYQRTAEKEITNIRWRVLGFGLPMSIAFGVLPLCAFAYAVVASPLSGSLVFWGPALVGIAVIGTFFLMMISVLELSSLAWLRQTDGPQR